MSLFRQRQVVHVTSRCIRAAGVIFALTSGLIALPTPGNAQVVATSATATRAQLNALKLTLNSSLANGKLKSDAKRQTVAQLAVIDARLSNGDLQVGDRLQVTIITDSTRSDSVSVLANLAIALPGIPSEVSVAAILRSELAAVLQAHVGKYLRNVSVRVVPLLRVQVTGEVRTPNYFVAPPDKPISELLALAGGPSSDADIRKLVINRDGREMLSAKETARAIAEGRTLEQIGIMSGDVISVPKKRSFPWGTVIQAASVVVTVGLSVILLLRQLYQED